MIKTTASSWYRKAIWVKLDVVFNDLLGMPYILDEQLFTDYKYIALFKFF